ncbi:hypothetical protein BEI64_29695 [Eisenbergiella tayi]|uniref:Uncharacterized protein n=1 Tax=Eisenbergiella tayi TaxID=1432052 RepID=A0ABX3ANQ0_9FIRM|nr:hypothetical protein BEI64_29695 [Eisenbergiella tayi]ODR61803.1 hypothetical protein BEI63_00200 [Eisenbergiella tayi]
MAGAEGRKSKPMGHPEAAAGRDRDMCGGWVIYYTFCPVSSRFRFIGKFTLQRTAFSAGGKALS